MHKRKALQQKPLTAVKPGEEAPAQQEVKLDKGIPHAFSVDRLTSAATFKFGRSI
jgi:hypothetical protein